VWTALLRLQQHLRLLQAWLLLPQHGQLGLRQCAEQQLLPLVPALLC
jgi:hypothetical protein